MNNPFKLEKLIIEAHSAKETGDGSEEYKLEDTFEVMFNPTSYSRKFTNVFKKQKGSDGGKTQAKLGYREQDNLDLEFIIDGTGVAQFGVEHFKGIKSVTDQVKRMVKLFLERERETHHPNLLVLQWGDFIFKGYLESMTVNYTLFDSSGKPLRAKVNASLIESLPSAELNKKEELHSADISRLHRVMAEDNLPLLTKEIYGTYDHLFLVARENDLNQFRKLEPGTQLFFPSLTK